MDIRTALCELVFRIERCFKCYKKFSEYDVEVRVRIRDWCHEGPWVLSS